MKKQLLLAAIFTFLLSAGYAQDKKVAVVTFYVNKQIDVTSYSGAAQVAMLKLCDDPNFNLTPLLKEFHDRFFESYAKEFPFQLLPETDVTGSSEYKAYTPVGIAQSGVLAADKYIIPTDGYKIFLTLSGHQNEKNMLKVFPQADGVMHVSINFTLVKIGIGNMGVTRMKATATILLINKNGDKVFNIEEYATSKGIVPLVGGIPVMSYEKIIPMCESAVDELMTDLQKDMPKLVKKANAKL